jgi:hypothetical protein
MVLSKVKCAPLGPSRKLTSSSNLDCPEPSGGAFSSGSPFSWPLFCPNMTQPADLTVTLLNNLSDQNTMTFARLSNSEWWYRAAYLLQIRWEAADFATKVASPTQETGAVALITPINVGPEGSGTSASPSSSSQPSSQSTGLSTGSIAAIAVVFGVVALAALITFVWWKRWAARNKDMTGQSKKGDYGPVEQLSSPHATDSTGKPHPNQRSMIQELFGRPVSVRSSS